ncbi:hypothetical protein [Floridanema evergladense]|uniref:DNA helicase n=1 Tax=Floridaenema evergladense BLCC-F167 TaxID=3153639 RepID=A0ABV4WTQ1_9CYAN
MPVKIIRGAFREIQKLSHENFRKVCKIISRLNLDPIDPNHTKSLQGYPHWRRTHLGDVRVIWERVDRDNILVIKAGLRRDIYDNLFDNPNCDDPLAIEELLKPDGIEVENSPTYQVPSINVTDSECKQEVDDTWYKFIYGGGYRYSPLLTPHQQEVLSGLTPDSTNTKAWIVQSAPGTGKTVCAALKACEMHREYDWNTMLIVPEALRQDVAQFSEIKQTLERNSEGFWLGTFDDFLAKVAPYLHSHLAKPEEEAEILWKLENPFLPKAQSISAEEIISYSDDVLLYQAFALNDKNPQRTGSPIYKANQERIQELANQIKPNKWKQNLGDKLCRLDVAYEMKSNPPSPPFTNKKPIVLIVDEAQDFLLAELQALVALRETWESQGYSTYLWFLGDLNQKIKPTDLYIWGHLELGDPVKLSYNYRNSQPILKFANQFLNFAKPFINRHREIPEPSDPETAFEKGELVSLVEFSSKQQALEFLELLNSSAQQEERERYFLRLSANRVKVLCCDRHLPTFNNLEIFPAEQAKGREFEACVAFGIFNGTGTPTLQESLQWYTLLTRPRSRLLVVATTQELERVGNEYFKCCKIIDAQSAAAWIAEIASDIDISEFRNNAETKKQELLASCAKSLPFFDTYLVLELAGIQREKVSQWEQEAIAKLRKNSSNLLKELEQIPSNNISLRCLLLRAMHRSWEAVDLAFELHETDREEYQRLLAAIAQDLENKNLLYEAARVRIKLGQSLPNNYPFPEIAEKSGSLLSLLCQAFIERPFSNV